MTKKKVSCPNRYHIEKLSNYVDLCFVDQNVLQRRRTKAKMVVEADEDLVEEEEVEVTMTRISGFCERLQAIWFICDIRLDIPDGSSYSPKSSKRETSNGGKATQSVSRPKGSSKGGRRH